MEHSVQNYDASSVDELLQDKEESLGHIANFSVGILMGTTSYDGVDFQEAIDLLTRHVANIDAELVCRCNQQHGA